MPIGFNSAARNLFLLGSSGGQIVSNFFKKIDQTAGTDGVYLPDEIKYITADQKYVLAGSNQTASSQGKGWIEKRTLVFIDNVLQEEAISDWKVELQSNLGTNYANLNTTLRALEIDYIGNLFAVGKTGTVPWVVKYTSNGVLTWKASSETAGVGYTGLATDSFDNVYACGSSSTRAYVERLSGSLGVYTWGRDSRTTAGVVTYNKCATLTTLEVIVVGKIQDTLKDKGYISKLGLNGGLLWERTIEDLRLGTSSSYWQTECTDVFVDSVDNIFVVGTLRDTIGSLSKGFLIKYSPEGNIIWQRETKLDRNFEYISVKSNGLTGETIVAGRFRFNNDDFMLLNKYSQDGTLIWSRSIFSSLDQTIGNVSIDFDPSFYYFIFTDETVSSVAGEPDTYTFGKLSTSGNGLGDFQYTSLGTTYDYRYLSITDNIGRLSDGSLRQDASDFITYPHSPNKILFDDYATQIANKKVQVFAANTYSTVGYNIPTTVRSTLENIVSSGLVLSLDAGNTKSLNIPTQADHGYADWYCLVSGTVTYSIINSTGGVIYERNGSTITTLVTASVPQRGTFSITAGRFYYGSVPINLVVEDQHHYIIPLTMMGTQFWSIAVRFNPSTYYVYSPYQSATVNFYDNTVGGLTGTPTSTLSLSAGQSGTFSSNNLTNHWISSNTPIIASVTQTGADKTILSPMSRYVYYRYAQYLNTTNSTTPTNNNTNVTYDSTYNVMNMTIGDGAGGDCAQGLGLEYLSDTYSWGNVLSDYVIICPYTATVTVSYWSGSAWVVWETHSNISGTITSPGFVSRDGSTGVGIAATNITGLAASMASGATLWKWEGTAPFYLAINDNADDEFSVLGWLSSRNTSPRSSNVITDITGGGNNGTLTNNPVFTLGNGGSLVFDGVDDFVSGTITPLTGNYTIELIFKLITSNAGDNSLIALTGSNAHGFLGEVSHSNKTIRFLHRFPYGGSGGDSFYSSGSINLNQIYSISWVRDSNQKIYINGIFDSQITSTNSGFDSSLTQLTIGQLLFSNSARIINGNVYSTKIYNRALTAQEISQNYNALRSRFGI